MKEDNHKEEDTQNGLPHHLSKVKAQHPFKTEEDYFEKFNSKLQNQIEDFEELKTIAPTLNNIPKYNAFEVPFTYFDELPTLVQQRIIDTKKTTSIIDWLTLLIKPRFVVPTLIVILIAFAGINFVDNNAKSIVSIEKNQELSVEDQLEEIEESVLMESLIAQVDNEPVLENDNIEEYLIDSNIDETTFDNELK